MATEMRICIRSPIGDSDTGYISTFHSFSVYVLQEDINAVGYPKSFLVLDNADIDTMLRIIYEERGLTLRDMTFSKTYDMIEMRKAFIDPDYYEHMISLTAEELYVRHVNHLDNEPFCIIRTGTIVGFLVLAPIFKFLYGASPLCGSAVPFQDE